MGDSLQSQSVAPNPARLLTRKFLAWVAALILAFSLIALLMVFISFSIFRHLYRKAPDPIASFEVNKTVKAVMPTWASVEVATDEPVSIKLSKLLEAEIPFKQDVDVWIDNDFTVPLDATFAIPIDQEVFVETEVPIETQIPLDGIEVQTSLWGLKNISIPLYGSFPVKMTIPFKRPIHVKTNAKVRVKQDVTVHVQKTLTFPLDLKAHVSLPIDDVFDISLPEGLTVMARVTEKIPVDVQVRLELPKKGFFQTDDAGQEAVIPGQPH